VIEKFEQWWDAEDYHQNCSCHFSCRFYPQWLWPRPELDCYPDLHNNPGGYEVCQGGETLTFATVETQTDIYWYLISFLWCYQCPTHRLHWWSWIFKLKFDWSFLHGRTFTWTTEMRCFTFTPQHLSPIHRMSILEEHAWLYFVFWRAGIDTCSRFEINMIH
jgi:hypothetical protein